MGNHPSSEASRAHPLLPRPPPLADRPLPPLPRPLRADELAHAHSHASAAFPRSSTLTSAHTATSARRHKFRKSKARSKSFAAADSKPRLVLNTDGLAKGRSPSLFSSASFANLVSALTPKSPLSATASGSKSQNTHKSSVSAKTSGPESPSIFTFEEAVAAYAGQRDGEPAARKPLADTTYPDPSLDLELLQEQQARQHEFEERQRLNLIQRQKRLSRSKTPMLSPGQFPQHSPQDYRAFDFQLDSTAIEDLVSDPTAEFDFAADFDFAEQPVDREPRKMLRQLHKERHQQQKQKQKQRQEQHGQKGQKVQKDKLLRVPFFRSHSTQRIARPENGFGDLDAGYARRNSIGSVYTYSTGQPSQDWPHAAGSRTSWNYDMSSYAAKRLLHIAGHNDPANLDPSDCVDRRHEQSSVASESRRSAVSEVTWKSSHPVQDENQALKRATSDLSLHAPVRRTSMLNIPGVATRRNSTNSFTNTTASPRPSFRHSHAAPRTPSSPPSLSRATSHESMYDYGLSMPTLRRSAPIASDKNAPPARVSTPTDHDNKRYSTIGAYTLGSLRITNGEAPSSPEPKKSGTVDAAGSSSPVRNPDAERKARSLALAALTGHTPVETSTPVEASSPVSATDSTKPAITLLPSPLRLTFGFFASSHPVPEPVKTPVEPPQVELSNDVFAGFEFSRSFSFRDPVTADVAAEAQDQCGDGKSMLEATSKTTAQEDLLFEDDDDRSTLGTAEVLDVRVDPSAKATAKRSRAGILATHKSVHSVQSVSRSDSGFISSPASETSHKPLSKADSGYSSNVSLRSFKQAASKFMAPVAKAANRMSPDRDGNRAPRESALLDELKLPGPMLGSLDRHLSTKSNYSRTPVGISAASQSIPSVPEPPVPRLVQRSSSARTSLSCPISQSMTPGSIQSPKSIQSAAQSNGSASTVGPESGAQRPSKMLRFLSFNNGSPSAKISPPILQVTHVEDDSPHTGRFPVTAKRLALRSQLSNNTLKTIFSVGSLENRGSNGDLRDSNLRDGSSRAGSRLSTHATDGTPKRKSRLHLAVDFGDEAPVNEADEGIAASEIDIKPLQKDDRGKASTGSSLLVARTESKSKTSRVPWRRRTKEGLNSQTQTQPQTVETGPPADAHENDKTRSRSSSIRSRTMSMTAQLERTLSMKLSFPRLSSNASKPCPEKNPEKNKSARPAAAAATARPARPLAPPVSFFSTAAHRNRDQRQAPRADATAHRTSVAKDTTATAAKTAARGTAKAGKPPVSARMQQLRPAMLHVVPPVRSQSTPPTEAAAGNRKRDCLYVAATSRTAAPSIKPAVDARWQVKTDHDTSQLPVRRASVDSASRTYHGPCVPHRSFSGGGSLFVQYSATESQPQPQPQQPQPQVQLYESQDEQPQSRILQYRASHDGYSSVATEDSQPHLPASDNNDGGDDIYQTPKQTGDYYYKPHARPPSAHNRSRSMESQYGPMPRSQAPYRVLHSYNSPAYRGVPIWG